MSNQTRFPGKDADFNNYVNIAIPYLTTNEARLLVTAASQEVLTTVNTVLTNATTGWNTVYQQSQNPAVATSTTTAVKNYLRSSIETSLRIIFSDIPESVLTQADRDTLNLPLSSGTHTPSPVPVSQPLVSISNRTFLSVTLVIVDSGHPQNGGKPTGVSSIQIEGAFFAAGSTPKIPTDADFRNIATTGKTSYMRSYASDQLAGTEYIRARYLNSRGEPGNWGETITVIVA